MGESYTIDSNRALNKAVTIKQDIGPITEIIIQGTPFCNYRCSYCYLSTESRSTNIKMSPHVAQDIIKFVITSGHANKHLIIRWHAGEPLAAGIDFYKQAVMLMDQALPQGYSIKHTLQTNASYINKEWCEFFKEHKFGVGVSIDGPEEIHNKYRVLNNTQGTFALTMKGINLLKKYEIDFDTISVITPEALDYPIEIYNFFKEIGSTYFGFNVEEDEGSRDNFSINTEQYLNKFKEFFTQIYNAQKHGGLEVREVRERRDAILYGVEELTSIVCKPFFMLNVDHLGNFSTFSPELLGTEHKRYGNFTLGNIYKNTIEDVLATKHYQKIYGDIAKGVQKCKQECSYYNLCGGGAPSNKLCENDSFNSTETFYCKSRFQIPIDIILSQLEQEINKE